MAERLTSSPRIYDIYGSCGLGILSEFFPHGDFEDVAVPGGEGYMRPEKLHDGYAVKPQNNLTAMEKLEASLQMVEALADLHGHAGGVIVHQDMQLSQYLWTEDKSKLKLNDFNRAEFLLWDEDSGEYCRYYEGRGQGTVRTPPIHYISSSKNFTENQDLPTHSSLYTFFFSINVDATSGDRLKNITTILSRKKSTFSRWGTTSIRSSQVYGHSTTRMKTRNGSR